MKKNKQIILGEKTFKSDLERFSFDSFLSSSKDERKILCHQLADHIRKAIESRPSDTNDWESFCREAAGDWARELGRYGHELFLWEDNGNLQKWGVLFFYGRKPHVGGIIVEFIFPYFVEIIWVDGTTPEINRIGHKEALESVRALHPKFESTWRDRLANIGPDSAPSLVWESFASTIANFAASGLVNEWRRALEQIEILMREGTDSVSECVAVFFVEQLLVEADDEDSLVPVLRALGPLTREYALAWNTSRGRSNLGLEY